MGKGSQGIAMVIHTRAASSGGNAVTSVSIVSTGSTSTRANGGTMSSMATGKSLGTTRSSLRDASRLASSTGQENTNTKMVTFSKATTLRTKSEAMASIISAKEGSWSRNSIRRRHRFPASSSPTVRFMSASSATGHAKVPGRLRISMGVNTTVSGVKIRRRAPVSSSMLTRRGTTGTGIAICGKGMAPTIIRMATSTKANGWMTCRTVLAHTIILTEISTRDNGVPAECMARATTSTAKATRCTRETGRRAGKKALGNLSSKTSMGTRASGLTIRSRAGEPTSTQMTKGTKASGRRTRKTELVVISTGTVIFTRDSGRMIAGMARAP